MVVVVEAVTQGWLVAKATPADGFKAKMNEVSPTSRATAPLSFVHLRMKITSVRTILSVISSSTMPRDVSSGLVLMAANNAAWLVEVYGDAT